MEIQIMHTLHGHFACLDGHYTHQQARRCVIAADLHDFCSLTRGFAALHARQPAPEKAAMSFGGSHELRAQVRQRGQKIGQKWSVARSRSGL